MEFAIQSALLLLAVDELGCAMVEFGVVVVDMRECQALTRSCEIHISTAFERQYQERCLTAFQLNGQRNRAANFSHGVAVNYIAFQTTRDELD
jgi:hypothetical protein